jgi:cyclohexyl-isocyanide hydratase
MSRTEPATNEIRHNEMTVVDHRHFLQAVAMAGLAASPAMAQSPGMTDAKPTPMHGVLGAASAGPGRPKIAMLLHPKMVLQDLVGPLTVFNLIHSEIHLSGRSMSR